MSNNNRQQPNQKHQPYTASKLSIAPIIASKALHTAAISDSDYSNYPSTSHVPITNTSSSTHAPSAPYGEGPTGSTRLLLQNPEDDIVVLTPPSVGGETPIDERRSPIVAGTPPSFTRQHAASTIGRLSTQHQQLPRQGNHHTETEEEVWNRRHEYEPYSYLHQQQPYCLIHNNPIHDTNAPASSLHRAPLLPPHHTLHNAEFNDESYSQLAFAIPALISFLLFLSTLISTIGLVLLFIVLQQISASRRPISVRMVFDMLYNHMWIYIVAVVLSVGMFGISFMTTIWTCVSSYAASVVQRQHQHHYHHHHHHYTADSYSYQQNALGHFNNPLYYRHPHVHRYRHPLKNFMFWWQLVLIIVLCASVAGLGVCSYLLVKDDIRWSETLMKMCKKLQWGQGDLLQQDIFLQFLGSYVAPPSAYCNEINASLKLMVAGTIFSLVCTGLFLIWNATCVILRLVNNNSSTRTVPAVPSMRMDHETRTREGRVNSEAPRENSGQQTNNGARSTTATSGIRKTRKTGTRNAATTTNGEGIKRYGTVLAD